MVRSEILLQPHFKVVHLLSRGVKILYMVLYMNATEE